MQVLSFTVRDGDGRRCRIRNTKKMQVSNLADRYLRTQNVNADSTIKINRW